MKKLRVGIVFGGKSTEHEISLLSARNIIRAIDPEKFDLSLLGIDKQGQWHSYEPSDYLIHPDDPSSIALKASDKSIALVPGQTQQQVIESRGAQPLSQLDVVFPIMHGTLGEDGSLQGLLRMANIPFVGSGVLGSAVCMDKDVAKRLLRDAGLPVAPFVTLTRGNRRQHDYASLVAELGLPLFVKPANQGSSVGVSKVENERELLTAVNLAFSFDHKVLVESAIVGREIECAVLGNDDPQASLCGEIVVNQGFYSYEAKYIDAAAATLSVPADLPAEVGTRIQKLAISAFQALDCLGLARVDVFLTPDHQVIINEINTLPGFTNISMYPSLWQASGLSHRQLVTRLIELALERHQQDLALQSSARDI